MRCARTAIAGMFSSHRKYNRGEIQLDIAVATLIVIKLDLSCCMFLPGQFSPASGAVGMPLVIIVLCVRFRHVTVKVLTLCQPLCWMTPSRFSGRGYARPTSAPVSASAGSLLPVSTVEVMLGTPCPLQLALPLPVWYLWYYWSSLVLPCFGAHPLRSRVVALPLLVCGLRGATTGRIKKTGLAYVRTGTYVKRVCLHPLAAVFSPVCTLGLGPLLYPFRFRLNCVIILALP